MLECNYCNAYEYDTVLSMHAEQAFKRNPSFEPPDGVPCIQSKGSLPYCLLPLASFINTHAIRHMTLDNDCNFIGGSNIPEQHLETRLK